jgi:membrane protease YdiL (CAAX protease family)
MGAIGEGLLIGGVAAVLLAFLNYWLLVSAPDLPVVRSLRTVYREVLEPLFARLELPAIVGISLAAGVCEETLFRGAIQTEWGLIPASVLFGVAHLGGSGTIGFGVWAAVIGSLLGALAIVTGGLLAPIIAHAVYDGLALAYIRWRSGGEARSLL